MQPLTILLTPSLKVGAPKLIEEPYREVQQSEVCEKLFWVYGGETLD